MSSVIQLMSFAHSQRPTMLSGLSRTWKSPLAWFIATSRKSCQVDIGTVDLGRVVGIAGRSPVFADRVLVARVPRLVLVLLLEIVEVLEAR